MLRDICLLLEDSGEAGFKEIFPNASSVPAEYRSASRFEAFRRAGAGWHRINDICIFQPFLLSGDRKVIAICMLRKAKEDTVEGRAVLRAVEGLIDGCKMLAGLGAAEGESLFRHLSHDLRRIGSSQGAAATEARRFLQMNPPNIVESIARIRNTIELQQLLSVRLDMADDIFKRDDLSDYIESTAPESVFDPFKKIELAFKSLALERNIFFDPSGRSFGKALVPPFFGIVPFAIIDNAVKYSPNGERIGILFVETNSEIRVSVRSKGPVIEASELSKIFERGYRAKSTSKIGSAQGSGLGLYIVKRIVEELCGGRVEAECLQEMSGIGSVTFRVIMPKC